MDELARHEALAKEAEASGRALDAEAAWRKAIAAEPARREPRRALAALLKREQRWNDLTLALRGELEHACPEDEDRYRSWMELADVYLTQLDRNAQAIDSAKRALECKPDGVEAFELLCSLRARQQNWAELVLVLNARLDHVRQTEARLALLEQIAAVSLRRPQGTRQAMQTYERMLEEQPGHAEASAALLELYVQLSVWDKLVLLKRDQILREHEGEAGLASMLKLAKLTQAKVKRAEVQLEIWRTVRTLDPNHAGALEALDDLYRRTQAFAELAEVLRTRIDSGVDPELRCKLLQRLALLFEDQLRNEPDADVRAIEAWRELLAFSPSNPRARRALRDLYLRRVDLDALDALYADHDARGYAVVLEQLLASAEGGARAGLLRRLCRIHRDELDNPKKALACMESLRESAPDDRDALQTLAQMYEQAGDYLKLSDVLTGLVELTEDAEGKSLLLQQLAVLCEERIGAQAAALRYWLEAMKLQPRDAYLAEEAERLAAESGDWVGLIAVYRALLDELEPERRITTLVTVARAQEESLHALEEAAESYQAILQLEPFHGLAQEGLVRVLLAARRFDALFAYYGHRLQLASDRASEGGAAARVPIYYEVAALLERQPGKEGEALEMLGRALKELPGDGQTLDRLEALAGRHELWESLLDLYREVASQPLPLAPQVELRSRLARIYEEQLSNPSRALATYRRVLELDPRNGVAQHAVARLQA